MSIVSPRPKFTLILLLFSEMIWACTFKNMIDEGYGHKFWRVVNCHLIFFSVLEYILQLTFIKGDVFQWSKKELHMRFFFLTNNILISPEMPNSTLSDFTIISLFLQRVCIAFSLNKILVRCNLSSCTVF